MKIELKNQAAKLKLITEELESALKHSKIASEHFVNSEVPRACAHALALEGHIIAIAELLAEIAKFHRTKAKV